MRIRINASDLVLEIISIVIAILLALGVNSWQENRKHQQLLRDSLQSIRQEIAANQRRVMAERDHHRAVLQDFERLLVRNAGTETLRYDQLRSTFQHGSPTGLHRLGLQNIAWQIAQNDGAVSYMDYRTRAMLTSIYETGDSVEPSERSFETTILGTPPAQGNNFYFSTTGALGFLGDLVAEESALSAGYPQVLKRLDADLLK